MKFRIKIKHMIFDSEKSDLLGVTKVEFDGVISETKALFYSEENGYFFYYANYIKDFQWVTPISEEKAYHWTKTFLGDHAANIFFSVRANEK